MSNIQYESDEPENLSPTYIPQINEQANHRALGHFMPLLAIALSHLVNDLYMGALAPILPLLRVKLGIGLAVTGGLGAIQVIAAATQPAFGFLADRKYGRQIIFLGPFLAAIGIGGVGLAPNLPLLVGLLIIAGVGASSFHPPAAAAANTLSGKQKSLGVSFFLAVGSMGRSLGPLLIAYVVTQFGLQHTWIMVLPALVVGVFLQFIPKIELSQAKLERKFARQQLLAHFWPLLMLWAIVALRSVTNINFRTFLPLLLTERGGSVQFAASLISIYFFTGAAGIIIGGYLTDRFGARPTLIGSVLVGVPFFFYTLHGSGILMMLTVAVSGLSLMAAHSICLVAAQEMLPEQASMVSGIMMGLALSIGGIFAPIIGWIAEQIGLELTLNMLIFSLLLTIPLALAIPFPRQMKVLPKDAH